MIEALKQLVASTLRLAADRLDPPVIKLQPAEFELGAPAPKPEPRAAARVEPKRGSVAWRIARNRGVLH